MRDIQLFFSIISLFAGVASISISAFINYSKRVKAFVYFIGFNASLFLIQNAITINLYVNGYGGTHNFLRVISKAFDIGGTVLSSFFGLFLVNYLLGKEIKPLEKRLFVAIPLLQLLGILSLYFNGSGVIISATVKLILLSVIAYEILTVLISYKQIASKELKKAIRVFIIISMVFFPFILLEAFRQNVTWISNLTFIKLMALPAFFMAINICTLVFAVTYFNSPAFVKNNQLTDYFKKKYNITEKESEVIELLISGLTYKQIADKLFIANKTVDNHVQNIYKKLEVTSKIQLSNLVRSREV